MKVIIILACFLTTLTVSTVRVMGAENQTRYQSAALIGVQGPVKEITMTSENPFFEFFKNIKFTKEGRFSKDIFAYSPEGYPIGHGLKSKEGATNSLIWYDNNNRPVYVTTTGDLLDKGKVDTEIIEFKYSGDVLDSYTSISVDSLGNEKRTVNKFHILNSDNYGNWTEREVESIVYSDGNASETKKYTEHRTLEYYPVSEVVTSETVNVSDLYNIANFDKTAEYNPAKGDKHLYNVSGPVKSVKLKSKNVIFDNTVIFDADGQLKENNFVHDQHGRVAGSGMRALGKHKDLYVGYDESGNISTIDLSTNIPNTDSFVYRPSYKDGLCQSAQLTYKKKKGDKTAVLNFSDYKFDNRGNWVSRKVKVANTDSKDNNPEEYVETRTITYYE